MSSETNETIYEYAGGLYKIVPGSLAVGKDGQYVTIKSTTPPFGEIELD
jgi:hypothetical protein